MAKKEISGYVKLQIKGGQANGKKRFSKNYHNKYNKYKSYNRKRNNFHKKHTTSNKNQNTS